MDAQNLNDNQQRHFVNPRGAETDKLHEGDFLSPKSDLASTAAGPKQDGGDLRRGGHGSDTSSPLPTVTFLKEQTDPTARTEQVRDVAGELAKFISGANSSIDIAIYNFNLKDPQAEKTVVDALNDRAAHGVQVRLAYFEPKAKGKANAENTDGDNTDAEVTSPKLLANLDPRIETQNTNQSKVPSGLDSDVGTEGIDGDGKLMHNKYIVRDNGQPDATVWTGSTNWTDEAFGRMENNIIQLKSPELASTYEQDFQQLWDAGHIKGTGENLHKTVQVGDSTVTVAFSPGDGSFIDSEVADRIKAASQSVHIASMDISSQKILQALADKIDQGVQVDGIYDGREMAVVTKDWEKYHSTATEENLALWNKVKDHLVEKPSASLSDLMHNKIVDIDDSTVVTGSYNFTASAMQNSENALVIQNPQIGKQYADYINDLEITYGGTKS